ncbi:MAG: hypothetical protein MUE85_24600 [Microscillaceae bacterium]|nr:hypothetical protein [Microscillaceae bacterium]
MTIRYLEALCLEDCKVLSSGIDSKYLLGNDVGLCADLPQPFRRGGAGGMGCIQNFTTLPPKVEQNLGKILILRGYFSSPKVGYITNF